MKYLDSTSKDKLLEIKETRILKENFLLLKIALLAVHWKIFQF